MLSSCALKLLRTDMPRPSGRRAGVWRYGDGTECGRSFVDGVNRLLEWDDLGLFRFTTASPLVEAWPHPGLADGAVAGAFAREIAPIVLQAKGCEALHASAVAGAHGAIAFCGVSGSGKSTLAYAMRGESHRQIADDHLVFTVDSDTVTTWRTPFTPSLRPPSAAYFGSPAIADADAADWSPLASVAILVPDATLSSPFTVDRIPPARAFSELLPHAHCFDPGDPHEVERLTEHYLTLVGRIPVHRVSYRPCFDALPDLVRAMSALTDVP